MAEVAMLPALLGCWYAIYNRHGHHSCLYTSWHMPSTGCGKGWRCLDSSCEMLQGGSEIIRNGHIIPGSITEHRDAPCFALPAKGLLIDIGFPSHVFAFMLAIAHDPVEEICCSHFWKVSNALETPLVERKQRVIIQPRVFEKKLNELVEPLSVSIDRLRIKWDSPKWASPQVFWGDGNFESPRRCMAKLRANQGVFQVHTRLWHGGRNVSVDNYTFGRYPIVIFLCNLS